MNSLSPVSSAPVSSTFIVEVIFEELISQNITFTQDTTDIKIMFDTLVHSLSFEQLAAVIQIYNLEVCHTIFFNQIVPRIIEEAISQNLDMTLFENDIITQLLELEQTVGTNFIVNCLRPDGTFDQLGQDQDLDLEQVVGVAGVYNLSVIMELILSNTVIRY